MTSQPLDTMDLVDRCGSLGVCGGALVATWLFRESPPMAAVASLGGALVGGIFGTLVGQCVNDTVAPDVKAVVTGIGMVGVANASIKLWRCVKAHNLIDDSALPVVSIVSAVAVWKTGRAVGVSDVPTLCGLIVGLGCATVGIAHTYEFSDSGWRNILYGAFGGFWGFGGGVVFGCIVDRNNTGVMERHVLAAMIGICGGAYVLSTVWVQSQTNQRPREFLGHLLDCATNCRAGPVLFASMATFIVHTNPRFMGIPACAAFVVGAATFMLGYAVGYAEYILNAVNMNLDTVASLCAVFGASVGLCASIEHHFGTTAFVSEVVTNTSAGVVIGAVCGPIFLVLSPVTVPVCVASITYQLS